MKHYTFYRENDKFDDILKDSVIKKRIYTKVRWNCYLYIALDDYNDKLASYITLKYGDELRTGGLVTDRTPIPFIDYQPKEPKWLKQSS